MQNSELQFIIRFRNEADAAIRRAQDNLQGLAASTRAVASAEDVRAAAHARAQAAMGKVTEGLVRFAAVAAPAVLAMREFANFETGLIAVEKTTGLAAEAVDELGAHFRKMSREVPVTVDEFLEIAAVAGQLGISSASDIQKFTEVVSKMGVATNLSGEDAATTLARILNITEGGVGGVERFASVLVRLGNNAAATESEIAYATNQIVQQTSRFGISADQTAAYAAAVASMGIRSETAGTSIGRVLNEIDTASKQSGKQLTAFAQITGLTEEAFQRLAKESPQEAFDTFLYALGQSMEAGENYLPVLDSLNLANAESLKVLGPLAKNFEKLAEFQRLAADEGGNPTALAEEAAKAYASFGNQIKIAMNAVREFGIVFGEKLAAAVLPVARGLADVVKWIIDLDESTNGLVTTILAAVTIMGVLAAALAVARAAWIAMSLAVAATMGPITLIVAAITGLIGFMISFKDRTLETTSGVTTWGDVFVTVYNRVARVVTDVIDTFVLFYDLLTGGNNDWVASVKSTIQLAINIYKSFANFMIALGVTIVDAFLRSFETIYTISKKVGQEIADTVIKPMQAIKLAAQGQFDAAYLIAQQGTVNFGAIIGTAQEAFKEGMDDITENFARDYIGEGAAAVQGIVDSVVSAGRKEIDGILAEAAARTKSRNPTEEGGTTTTTTTDDDFKPPVIGDRDLSGGAEKELTELEKAYAKLNSELDNYLADQRLANELIGLGADAQIEKNRLAEFENRAKEAGLKLDDNQLALLKEGIALEQQARQDQARYQINTGINEFVEAQRQELELLGLSNEERELANVYYGFINQAKAEGIELGEVELAQLVEGLELMRQRQEITAAQRQADAEARAAERESLSLYGMIAADAEESMLRVRDAAVSVAANVQRGFADAFANAIVYSEDLGASMQKLARQALADIISSLIQIGIQFMINKLIGETVMASITASSAGAAAATATAWAPAAAAVSLATAGANSAPAGLGIATVHATSKALSAIKLAEGGMVNGPGTGTSDSIPAWLSNGEFVVNAKATAAFHPLLEAINRNKFASGGLVGDLPSMATMAMGRGNAGGTPVLNINAPITIQRSGGGEGSGKQDAELASGIANAIADKVREVLADEMRSGGMLGG